MRYVQKPQSVFGNIDITELNTRVRWAMRFEMPMIEGVADRVYLRMAAQIAARELLDKARLNIQRRGTVFGDRWAPLAKSTVYKHRAFGKKFPMGVLAKDFVSYSNDNTAFLGVTSQIPLFMHYGTKPHQIAANRAPYLKFPYPMSEYKRLGSRGLLSKVVMRGKRIATWGARDPKTGRMMRHFKRTEITWLRRKQVSHPGTVPRVMFPSQEEGQRIANDAAMKAWGLYTKQSGFIPMKDAPPSQSGGSSNYTGRHYIGPTMRSETE